jgi:hypothetical protein
VRRACVVVALMASGALLTPVVAAAQSTAEVPRTAWGVPDLGGTWDFAPSRRWNVRSSMATGSF